MPKGRVKSFDTKKGYGFITVQGAPDVFVFITSVVTPGITALRPGDEVSFDLKEGSKGKTAENVVVEKRK